MVSDIDLVHCIQLLQWQPMTASGHIVDIETHNVSVATNASATAACSAVAIVVWLSEFTQGFQS